MNREPQIGSLICYNPVYYKGITLGRVVGFSKVGLPKIIDLKDWGEYLLNPENSRWSGITPKTGFVIVEE